jgi:AAA domain-containing protein/protein kinase-like protein
MSNSDEAKPQIVCGRYVLTDPVRYGGMSVVQKVFDPQESRFCAIKRMKPDRYDEIRGKESFHREYAALNDVSAHPNIVTLYDAGSDDYGFYMVLEWVPENLVDWINRNGPQRWSDFYPSLGLPILQAISYAQSRGWNHRDIKPQNILITDDGSPKIADYGIAKQFEKPALGLTFNQFRSVPFTPPEDDSGNWSGSRDCFSWAAVSVYCLTGTMPTDYGALSDQATGLDRDSVPVAILHQALSHNPAERPPLASALLADLNTWWATQFAQEKVRRIYLQIDQTCLTHLLRALGASDRREVEAHVTQELNEVDVGLKARPIGGGQVALRISAVTWVFEVQRSGVRRDCLVIKRAWPFRAGDVERHRETGYRVPLEFTFATPLNSASAAKTIEDLFFEVEAFEAENRDRHLLAQRERVFRVWYAFLRAKADYEGRRENAITYVDCRFHYNIVTLTTEIPPPLEIVGQSRVIRSTSGKHVFCDIVDTNLDEVVVAVTFGDASTIPRRGRLDVNTIAAEKSIERQRQALDAINYDRAASPRLKGLLVDPSSARPPIKISRPKVGGGPFDPEKADILQSALGTQDILAIQGPPGTGKTRLIEEILAQYLSRNQPHRTLLSSQTHVALDNVIERVRVREPGIDIVRIGRLDDPKISSKCRDLVLARKAEAWSEQVRSRARTFMNKWAESRGLNRSSIEIGMLAERLILLLQQQRTIRSSLTSANRRVAAVEEDEETKLDETGSADSPAIDTAAVEAEQNVGELRNTLARVNQDIDEVRARLRATGGYGIELAEQTEEKELADWSSMLLGQGENQMECRALMELQEEWMLRVGRSSDFHAAMLTSAQVVAGTCIGMAGVRGMENVVYDLCIVDEASKATATEILVPMSRSRKWILVGDPAQLPPFFENDSITL